MNTAEELFEGPAALPAPPEAATPPAPRRRRGDWVLDLLNHAAGYLPLILMALLALGSWWLVRSAPGPEPVRTPGPPRGEPDYAMERFVVQRFATDGALRARIEGDRLRHFPDSDTLLVDNARLQAVAPDGRITIASARRATATSDASELQLEGGARVRREPFADEPAIEFSGERLKALRHGRLVVADAPVTVKQGERLLRADRLRYDHTSRVLELSGRVRVTWPAAPR